MKRYIKTLLIICGVTLLSACATRQEAAPDADGAAPAKSEEALETPPPEPVIDSPAAEPPPAEPAPSAPAAAPPADSAPSVNRAKEEAPDEASPDSEATDGVEAKGSADEPKPAQNNRRLRKPSKAGPAAKDAPCDPDKNEDCDPSLLRKLPGR